MFVSALSIKPDKWVACWWNEGLVLPLIKESKVVGMFWVSWKEQHIVNCLVCCFYTLYCQGCWEMPMGYFASCTKIAWLFWSTLLCILPLVGASFAVSPQLKNVWPNGKRWINKWISFIPHKRKTPSKDWQQSSGEGQDKEHHKMEKLPE